MVRLGGVVLCLLIVAMDVGAGLLGIQAEVAQNKVKHLRLWIFECRDPSHEAFKLGVGAAILLGLAHVLINTIAASNNCNLQTASPNTQISMACLLFSWIILAVGLSTLVIGTLSNNKSNGSCGFTHHHFLSIGGILCFVHALFSVAYYVSATADADHAK